MKALKDAQKRQALKGTTVSGGSGIIKKKSSSTTAIGSGKASKKAGGNNDDADVIKFQPHRDVIDAGKLLKELGDTVNTRYMDHDDLDQLDAGLGLNHDADGQAMIDEARTAAGDRRQAVAADVKQHLFGKGHVSAPITATATAFAAATSSTAYQPPNIDAKMAFIGHNRNTVTCCTVLDMTIFYGDKTGHVFRAEPNVNFRRATNAVTSHLTTSSSAQDEYFYQRIPMNPKHKGAVLSLAVSDTRGNRPANWGKERSSVDMSVLNYLVSGGQDGAINVWKAVTGEYVGVLKMHRAPVTGLCFRQWSSMLVSSSADTTVRLWSVPEMHCEDKYFGHNGPISGISSLRKERCATSGADRTVRHWKLDAATQVEFSTEGEAAECVAMLDDIHIVAGSAGGKLFLFDTNRRFPIQTIEQPHGVGFVGDGTGLEMLEGKPSPIAQQRGNAITAIAALPYGDLVATGSYSGTIALWHFAGHAATSLGAKNRGVGANDHANGAERPTNRLSLIATFPCKGCINNLQFSPDGSVLIASVGKDQRQGRWLTVSSALNGVIVIPLHKKGEDEVSAVTATTQVGYSTAIPKKASSSIITTANVAANKEALPRRMLEALVQDPSHQPLTEQAKLEARRKKRQELLAKQKASREAQIALNKKRKAEEEGVEDEDENEGDDDDDEGDAIDNWEKDAPAKKKTLTEKKKKQTTAASVPEVVVPTRVPSDEDDATSEEDDDFGIANDFDDNADDEDGFTLGKDGQFVMGGSDDEDEDDAPKKKKSSKQSTAAVGEKKLKKASLPAKKGSASASSSGKKMLRKSSSYEAPAKKKKIAGGKRK